MLVRFGEHAVDTDARHVEGPDGLVPIEPQVFDVLVHLIEHRDRVVPKHELLDEVWGSRFVSESALTSRIKSARRVVGDDGRAQHTIRTSHGTGYRFVAEVTVEQRSSATDGTDIDARSIRRLPRTVDRFHGRERELGELRELLVAERLVTLVGTGGTGKTRLAVEAAGSLDAATVVFVDLVPVRDERALDLALVAALGLDIGAAEHPLDAACAYLRARPVVLVVDNCEHVVGGARATIGRLVDETEAVVLATSRVPLGIRAERIVRLGPLPVLIGSDALSVEAATGNDAIALFLDRARRVDSDFALDEGTLPAIVSLCASLDGLPLAVELAAARMSTFGPADLVERLDRRLDLLGEDRHDERHRSLRTTLEWSHELLGPEEQRLFRFLAAFPAGLSLDAVEWLTAELALGGDAFGVLDALVAASLVQRVSQPSGTRYVQLETMRAYGLDLLDGSDDRSRSRDLVVAHVLRLLDRLEAERRSPAEIRWNDLLRRELPNLRAARAHLAATGRIEELVGISVAVHEWAKLRDVGEIWVWADELAARDDLPVGLESRVAAVCAQAEWRRGRFADAAARSREAIDRDDDPWAVLQGLSSLGVASLFTGDLPVAISAWDRAGASPLRFDDRANAALCHAYAGDADEAARRLAVVRAEVEVEGGPSDLAWVDYVTGEIRAVTDPRAAVPWLEAAVDRAEETGGAFIGGVAGVTLCTAMVASGRTDAAAGRYRDLITHWLRSGTWTQLWTTLRNAAVLVAEREPGVALQVLEAADADALAPGVDDSTAAELAALRAGLVARLADDEVERRRAEIGFVDRGVLAERLRSALADVAGGDEVTSDG
ncbi:MAG: winged helix-turn-helix domain-containing protein [Actinomycetota bacterium]